MSLPPPSPPQDDDPIITQFKPVQGQWGLNDSNINRIGCRGETILHNYWKYINTTPIEVYRYLIEVKGCDINARDNDNDTPLHCALREFNPNKGGEITVLMYLLSQNGIDGDTKGERGYTILHDICSKINKFRLDIFKVLIETMGCDVNAQNDDGSTPLHKALECFNPRHGGDIAVLKYLLSQKGVNGNIKDKYGYTLLHTACDNMNKLPIDVFKILIETLGCDINVQDNCKQTPLHNALGGFEPNYGDITVLTYLLSQKGINVNIKGWNGETLLHAACKKARRLPLEIFQHLIEPMGCDIHAQDDDNDTPLHHAFHRFYPRKCGNIAVLTYLLSQNNVNLNVKGKQGFSLLHLACINNLPSYKRSAEREAKCDIALSQIVEFIAERCVQEVFDEKDTSLEATTTM